MNRIFPMMFSIVMLILLIPAAAETAAADQSGTSVWTVQLAGAFQINGGGWKNWYTVIPEGPTYAGSVSASNGIQDVSLGFDSVLERGISDRFVLGIAAGFVPTRLHAEVHHTEESGIVIEKPRADISFFPVRLRAGFEVLRWSRWNLQAGLQFGCGVFGTRDVRPAVGRARRFFGGPRLLAGLHVALNHMSPSGWGYSVTLQHLRTTFRVEELGTGELPDQLNFFPTSLLVGVRYSFPATGR